MFTPKCCPPTNGTQLGAVKLIVFNPSIAILTRPITAFNGALAAFYNKVTIGHIEAGLRSYDLYSPFPEEANRKLTGVITKICLKLNKARGAWLA